MRESRIRAHLKKCVKKVGGEIRKLKWIGRRGAPDELVLLEKFSCLVELKATGEKLDPHQQREHHRLRRSLVPVAVLDNFEDVESLVFEKRIIVRRK